MRHFDAIIVGAGQAGPALAGRLTGAGMSIAFVEREAFGGTCVNTGCTPTKTLVASAYAAHLARRGRDYGVEIGTPPRIDMARVKARADAIVRTMREGVEKRLRDNERCTVIEGHARFEAPDQLRVGGDRLQAPRIFLDVGARPVVPNLPGLETVSYLTNASLLALDRVPEHLLIVGGSYIGLEFAQMYRRFGAEVTVVEKAPRLIAQEDPEISDAIAGILGDEGIGIRTGAECIRLAPHARGVAIGVECTDEPATIAGTHVLLAVGRRPNTDDLGLEHAGVATDEKGYITVDEGLATNVPGIWALGDCNGRGAFTHTAYNDFEIVAANLLDGQSRRVSDRVFTYALYVDPPLGRVGMTERAARTTGRPLLIASRPMTSVSRAIEKGETKGLMKVVVDAGTRRILGAAILGVGGDEAVHGVIDVVNADVPYEVLQWAMPIHPTVSELIPTLLGSLKPADDAK